MTTKTDQPFLRIERRFDVSPETVFDTLTKPELLPIWWGDDAEFDIDLKVGGQWKIIRWEGEVEYLAKGTYLKVERPSRLQYTFAMPRFSANSDTIIITIKEINGESFVTFEHSGDDIAAELREVPPGETSATEAGWQQAFDLMEEAWSKSG